MGDDNHPHPQLSLEKAEKAYTYLKDFLDWLDKQINRQAIQRTDRAELRVEISEVVALTQKAITLLNEGVEPSAHGIEVDKIDEKWQGLAKKVARYDEGFSKELGIKAFYWHLKPWRASEYRRFGKLPLKLTEIQERVQDL